MQHTILSLLESVFGEGKLTNKDNHSFYCPVCKHRKRKLEIGIESMKWHCWVCNSGGTNLFSLFKWAGVSKDKTDELRIVVGKRRVVFSVSEPDEFECKLPEEYKPLWVNNEQNFFWRKARNYAAVRGITELDIIRYRIGYCDSGLYASMLIIPNYDSHGRLNYFVTRAYLNNIGHKFLNPPVSKNVIGFELMINWKEPIVLVESALDAIVVRRNAIPLYGKAIPMALRERVLIEKVRTVYICLDSDAIVDAINHVQFFLDNGIDVYLTTLPRGEDPNSIGYPAIWDYINSSTLVDESQLFKLRMEENLYGGGKAHIPHGRRSYSSVSKTQRISGSFR